MDSKKPYVHQPFPQYDELEEETPPHGHQLNQLNAPDGFNAPNARGAFHQAPVTQRPPVHTTGGFGAVAPQPHSMTPANPMHAAYAPTPPHGSVPISAHTPWPPVPVAQAPTGFAGASTSGTFEAHGIPAPAHITGAFQAVGQAGQPGSFGPAPSSITGAFGAAPSSITGAFGAAPSAITGSFGAVPGAMTGSFPAQNMQASAPAKNPEDNRVSYGIWGGLAGGLVGVSLGVFNAILEGTALAQAQDPLIIITMASMFFSGGICAAYPTALQRQLKRAGITFGEDT